MKITLIAPSLSRIDTVLLKQIRKEYPLFSRSMLKSLFKNKKVRNDDTQTPISGSEQLSAHRPMNLFIDIDPSELNPTEVLSTRAEDHSNPIILFEDQNLIAIDKPSGVPTIPQRPTDLHTAVHLALHACPELKPLGEMMRQKYDRDPRECGVLHRLDTSTSGVLAFAKTEAAWKQFKEQWKTGPISKQYRAICRLGPNVPASALPKPGTLINHPMAHSAKSAK